MEVNERRKWLLNKLKNPLILILILGLVLRLYYLIITYGKQVLWYDSAIYLNYARFWSHGLFYDFTPARPILFSIIMAGFNFISTSEIIPRLFLIFFSMLAILGMYYLARSLTDDKRIGWIAAFISAIFYLNLFYTNRILVDTLSYTFFIWSAYFFHKYFKKDKVKYFYIASVIVAIGFLFRLTTAIILLVVLFYTIVIDGIKMFKKKEYYIGALIFLSIISPYLIWGYYKFHGFVLTKAFETNAPTNFWVSGYHVLIGYLAQFLLLLPNNLGIPMAILFVIGLIMMYGAIVGIDLAKKGDKKLRKDLFLLLLFIVPLIFISFMLNHNEDRYIFNIFPAIFILISIPLIYIYDYIKNKWDKKVAFVFIILILTIFTYSQLQTADFIIKNKMYSYQQVKEAGLWIKDNSQPGDIIITHSYPQIQYYSWRYSRHFPKTEEEFELLDKTNFTYFMISIFEKSPEWAYAYPNKHNLTVAKGWMLNDKQPAVAIYYLQ